MSVNRSAGEREPRSVASFRRVVEVMRANPGMRIHEATKLVSETEDVREATVRNRFYFTARNPKYAPEAEGLISPYKPYRKRAASSRPPQGLNEYAQKAHRELVERLERIEEERRTLEVEREKVRTVLNFLGVEPDD